ncbi:MAG: GIY-YIG nuclease family protein [Patescibacteria group bacterium]|jgi:putative endonuclease|nr:GIY-YIG nuclease family protein [Patescibacteria group bacterium]
MMWFVYILKCSDGTFYTGITKDLERRIEEHNSSVLGAKYTRGRRPVSLVFSEEFRSRTKASQEEYRIKKISREKMLKLIKNFEKKTMNL